MLGVAQRLATQRNVVDASFDGTSDETSFFENSEVLGDRRLGRSETAAEISSASGLPARQSLNDRPPGAVR